MTKECIKKIGVVGVDSGQILITDPCYIGSQWKDSDFDAGKKGEYSYGGACKATMSDKGAGQLNYELGHAGAGVAACSGYGDGCYPVYAQYNGEGRIARILIDFEAMPGEVNEKIFNTLCKADSK